MSTKTKWPWEEANRWAECLKRQLEDSCERIIIAGSIRRRKSLVGDIELVFVPKMAPGAPGDFFAAAEQVSLADKLLDVLLEGGMISKRLNVNGSPAWGPMNKLGVHCSTGIAVDFFAIKEEAWWNYLVCRTGGADSNTEIASRAKAMGWMWKPTNAGFMRVGGSDHGRMVTVTSEREVFEFVKMTYLEPEERK